MSKSKNEKRKAKRKAKQKKRRLQPVKALIRDKIDYLFEEADWYNEERQFEESLACFEKIMRLDPKNEHGLRGICYLGHVTKRPDLELKGLLGLCKNGQIKPNEIPLLCQLLDQEGSVKMQQLVIEKILKNMPELEKDEHKTLRDFLERKMDYCQTKAKMEQSQASRKDIAKKTLKRNGKRDQKKAHMAKGGPQGGESACTLPEIPMSIQLNAGAFGQILSRENLASMEDYRLTLEGYKIRFQETFESLICLNSLHNIRSFWFQEETARKILKTFHGRALLADEVGLGKTIEALMVLKEYIQRGMVKNAIILTPTPLVSQWKEELASKFGLYFPSTDDADFKSRGQSFWKEKFILASINIAKSKKNFSAVTQREYDMVIVDEAHHLKNRSTLNWKLVNALKKRFLLLLTATPVENNLMELYNIITLLKPGQLKTASTFRKEFMTRGDPTDPQNRNQLKELLGQVMVRNTRAFAKIDIPPRFAQTINVQAEDAEIALYQKTTALVKEMGESASFGHKMLLKNLLAEAGSSPRALSRTLFRMFEGQGMPAHQQKKLHDLNRLCRVMHATSKDRMLLKLIGQGKMIIFVKYLGTLEHISDFLSAQGIAHSLFHGSMDNRSKDQQIELFRQERDVLLTTEIGGEGRNLQFCHQMLNYDLPWNPMKIEQRIGRIHRIGQEHEVNIYNLCAEGSIEEYILEILDKKINMFEMVIGEIDMILGRLQKEKDFSEMVYDIWVNSGSEQDTKQAFKKLAGKLVSVKKRYQKSKELDQKLFGENYEI